MTHLLFCIGKLSLVELGLYFVEGIKEALGPPAENLVELLLKASERHVQQEEQSGREEIDETEPEPGSVCVLEPHGRSDLSEEIRLTVAIWCRISENSPDRDSSRPCVMSFMMNSSFRGAEISSKYSLAISQLVW